MQSLAVLMLAALVGNGLALLCRNCVSSSGFEECESTGDAQLCDANIVNANHANHDENNPTLLPGNATEFKCYHIQISRMHPNGTAAGIRSYARGCTFNSTNFCSGWVSSLNVTSCGTCTTDNCDQAPIVPTPEASRTTEAPRQTTSVAPGATRTEAPRAATTVAPVASKTTVTTVETTTVAIGTTTVAPSNATTETLGSTTNLAPEVTTTLATKEPTTRASEAKTTDKPDRAMRRPNKFTIEGTGVLQIATAVYVFCNIFCIVLTLFIVFGAYSIHSSLSRIQKGYAL